MCIIDGFDSLANVGFALPFTCFLYVMFTHNSFQQDTSMNPWQYQVIDYLVLEKLLVRLCKLGNANEF